MKFVRLLVCLVGVYEHDGPTFLPDMTGKIKAKGSMDANNSWWASELLSNACQKERGSARVG